MLPTSELPAGLATAIVRRLQPGDHLFAVVPGQAIAPALERLRDTGLTLLGTERLADGSLLISAVRTFLPSD